MVMAEQGAVAVGAIEIAASRWSPRHRTIFILASAAILWTIPIGFACALARLLS